ncbi:MAG TPA: SCP2 sterol-binding domain-containing protein [Gammaproteobacteria bacterium]
MSRSSSAIHLAETALNRVLRLDPEFLEALAPLQDRILAVEFSGITRTFYAQLGVEGVTLLEQADVDALRPGGQADVSFSGSPPAMLRMASAMRRGASTIGEDVRITGDLAVLESLKSAFQRLDVDFEELLSRYVGDVAAHEIGRFAQVFQAWSRRTRETLLADTGEFLVEELRISPPAIELEDFAADVNRLRDDVERLEKRVARIQATREGTRE